MCFDVTLGATKYIVSICSFVGRFYWFFNMGAIIAYTAVAYVQQNVGFAEGFAIPMFVMLISVIIFIIPRSRYVENPPHGNLCNIPTL